MSTDARKPPSRLRRWLLRLLIAAAALALLAIVTITVLSERRLRATYPTAPAASTPRATLVAEGRHLAASRGCEDCHGKDLAGYVIADDPMFGRLMGTNLTRLGDARQTHDSFRSALLHGVRLDGTPLLMMPSREFSGLSAREIEALAAYTATIERKGVSGERSELRPLGRTLLALDQLDGFLSAEVIDHTQPIKDEPPKTTLAYGGHLAAMCTGCHRPDFAGGRMAHGKGDAPPAANLTPDTVTGLGTWTEKEFIAAIRTGVRPNGTRIDGSAMPLSAVGQATDEELKAIWAYLTTRPAIRRDVHSRTE